jgi:hypothetical protein
VSPRASGPLAGPLAPTHTARQPAAGADPRAASDATLPLPARAVRLSHLRLLQLADRLSGREREILETVGRFRLLRAGQIRRLFFSEISTATGSARVCRRSLQRLSEHGLLRRLERRIGGTRAGSNGHVYALGAPGRRLVSFWSGTGIASDRGAHEPGAAFVAHTLAIAELYVALVEADRDGVLELLAFDTEPICWRTFKSRFATSTTLRPDAFVRVASGDYEYASFAEVDLGTEGRGALLRKCRAYLDYYQGGREQAEHRFFPRVVWITATTARACYLDKLIEDQPVQAKRLFVSTRAATAIAALIGDDGHTGEAR